MTAKILIREAKEDDLEFVTKLMVDALSPFYGGDHVRHARRIFDTHISGGKDNLGFFSSLQKMFVAEVYGERVGIVHIVGKRQATFKISPLIVDKSKRGRLGVGSALLQHAEDYASQHKARQIYCTVAKQNQQAFRFFRRKGYIAAGDSHSHYKDGVTEVMLYKQKISERDIITFDRDHISVLPMRSKHESDVRRLLLEFLPPDFSGIDDNWVQSLFSGYERRTDRDINQKYKLLYVATDRSDNVVGVAGATPKKGEPIKLMPLIATTEPAFFALLSDVPVYLRDYGKKVYVHIVPNVAQTMFLQKAGWSLNGVLPAAYREDIVTQQWSIELKDKNKMRVIRLKQKYLDFMRSGKKDLEVRVAYSNMKTVRPGELIRFVSRNDELAVTIEDVRRYQDFDQLLQHEDHRRIVPDMSVDEVRSLLGEIYPPKKQALGVLVFEVACASS